jgi:hypothetical protein
MKEIDLKPCPHCGGEKLRIEDNGIYAFGVEDKPDAYWAVCLTCFASGGPGGEQKRSG